MGKGINMLFPTQRQQYRYPMPPPRNQLGFGRPQPPNRGFGLRSRSVPTNNAKPNLLGRLLGSQQQFGTGGISAGGGLSKTLGNIQQVLNVVQSTAPIVQEYGPMIKNLPAMYRMMKAFKDIDKIEDASENDDDKEENKQGNIELNSDELADDSISTEKEKSESNEEVISQSSKEEKGLSTPKLFI